MKKIGFPISHKENEDRRALVPADLARIKNVDALYFEKGYGEAIGYEDAEYEKYGVHIASRQEVLEKDIICDPKIGDAEYLLDLSEQTIFGWVHAVQNKDITDKVVGGKLTAYTWEDMFENGKHTFYRNNQIAGEAAVMHAFQCYGDMPYNTKVALLGCGNVATGAKQILTCLGAEVDQYDYSEEKKFKERFTEYDVVVNAILWDTSRTDHIIYREDLKKMKKGSMIIDISCDKNGGIESSIPTTIDDPYYFEEGVMHYVVDHTPSLFAKAASKSISEAVAPFIDYLVEEKENEVLAKANPIVKGEILDKRIIEFQKR